MFNLLLQFAKDFNRIFQQTFDNWNFINKYNRICLEFQSGFTLILYFLYFLYFLLISVNLFFVVHGFAMEFPRCKQPF